jgi:hypothetical protein
VSGGMETGLLMLQHERISSLPQGDESFFKPRS